MTLNQLTYFFQAATLEHFNLAAEKLHISEPSLSRSMSALENELGISLFEKKGRNVSLTKAGRLFLSHAEIILSDISHAEQKMHEIATDGGHIDIGYVGPLAQNYLPKMIRAFLENEENKNVNFNFYRGYTHQLIEGLKSKTYDIVFGAKLSDEKDIEFVPIIQQKMVVIVPKNHPIARLDTVDHSIFYREKVLSYDKTSGLGKETRDYFTKYDIDVPVSFEFPDEPSIASFVAAGFGIALVADVDAVHRDDLAIKELVEDEQVIHSIYMAYLRGTYVLPAITRLIHFIKNTQMKG